MADTVIICIPTFRRPKMLRRLLDAIALLQTSADVSVLVADKDSQGRAGLDLCLALEGYRWPLTAVFAPDRGIAQTRNLLVEYAVMSGASFIAMIDDDEWPDPHWIDQLLKTADRTHADVVQGRGHLLIRRSALEDMAAPWFDPQFAAPGEVDRDFFHRLSRAGKHLARGDEALVHSEVPDNGTNLGWLLRQSYSVGNSDMRVLLKHHPSPPQIAKELLKILPSLLLAPLAAAILGLSPNRRVIPLQKFFLAAGRLSAMAGRHYREYAVIHGE